MKVDWLIDRPTRELPFALYNQAMLDDGHISIALDHQDFYVKRNKYDFFERTRHVADVIVTPNYNTIRSRSLLARAIRTNVKGFVVQHSEQLFPEIFYAEKFNLQNSASYRRHVGAHIVWGKDFAQKLIKYSGVSPENIYIAGNPKLDLAQRIHSHESNANKIGKPTVLLASNFNLGDRTDRGWKKLKKMYGVTDSAPLNRIYSAARKKAVDWISDAAESFEDIHFIVRTHPGESSQDYDLLRKFQNVEITGDKPFIEDLKRCRMMFCFTSSSIFEALSLGIPVFSLNLTELPKATRPAYYDDLVWLDKAGMMTKIETLLGDDSSLANGDSQHQLDKYMWKVGNATLLRNAIAIEAACRDICDKDSRFSFIDRLQGYSYSFLPLLKSAFIYSGYAVEKVSSTKNRISRWAELRWQRRMAALNFLDDGLVDGYKPLTNLLFDSLDIDIHRSHKYQIVQTDHGKYIELLGQ